MFQSPSFACCGSFAFVHAYMNVVLVPCVRPRFGQADYHMTTLPLLGHDGKEELYWARVSLMPSEGHMFSV